MTIRTSPSRMPPPLMTLKGVNIFPFGFSSDKTKRMVSRATSRKVTAPSAGAGAAAHPPPPGGAPFLPGHEGRPQLGFRVGLCERSPGEEQPAGPADFVLPVDVVDVPVRIRVDPGPGDLQQISLLPEECRPGRAHLGAGGRLPLLLPLVAEDALPHVGGGAVVLELRDVERARDHAVTAPHAPVLVVNDRGLLGLLHRPAQARGGARRLVAVHALPPDEDRLVRLLLVREPVNDREGARGGLPLLLETPVPGEGETPPWARG